jgi:hypothetical protein
VILFGAVRWRSAVQPKARVSANENIDVWQANVCYFVAEMRNGAEIINHLPRSAYRKENKIYVPLFITLHIFASEGRQR